jgi:hypothetical protein
MSFCRVQNCRYSTFHVTSAHQCGNCKFFGHGQMECIDQNKKNNLEKYHHEIIDHNDFCKVNNCKFPKTHKTSGHCCLYCGKRDTHMNHCPTNVNTILTDPRDFTCESSIIQIAEKKNIAKGYYIFEYGGLGSTWFIRNNNGKIEYFFMYSDSWGQYGEDTSEIPKINCFLRGYKFQS